MTKDIRLIQRKHLILEIYLSNFHSVHHGGEVGLLVLDNRHQMKGHALEGLRKPKERLVTKELRAQMKGFALNWCNSCSLEKNECVKKWMGVHVFTVVDRKFEGTYGFLPPSSPLQVILEKNALLQAKEKASQIGTQYA